MDGNLLSIFVLFHYNFLHSYIQQNFILIIFRHAYKDERNASKLRIKVTTNSHLVHFYAIQFRDGLLVYDFVLRYKGEKNQATTSILNT